MPGEEKIHPKIKIKYFFSPQSSNAIYHQFFFKPLNEEEKINKKINKNHTSAGLYNDSEQQLARMDIL